MSDLWIAAKPRIDEPSNITPSVKKSSGSVAAGTLRCCGWPGGSVKRTSTNSTFSFLMKLRTSSELLNIRPPLRSCYGREAMFRRLPSGVPNVSGTFRRGQRGICPTPGRRRCRSVGRACPGCPGRRRGRGRAVPAGRGGRRLAAGPRRGGAAGGSQRVPGAARRDPDDPQAEQVHAEGPAGDEEADDVVERERDE